MARTWTAFERDNNAALKQQEKNSNETILCGTCGCKFFHQLEVYQYKANHNAIIGQTVPSIPNQTIGYMLLQCIRCGDYTEPNVDTDVGPNAATADYNVFLDELEGKDDKREPQEDLKAKIEVMRNKLEELSKSLEPEKPKGRSKKNDVQDKE